MSNSIDIEKLLSRIDKLIDIKLDQKLDEKLGLAPGQTLDDKLAYLPSKQEFYSKMDELMTELKAMREEVAVVTGYKGQIEDHEIRLGTIEKAIGPLT